MRGLNQESIVGGRNIAADARNRRAEHLTELNKGRSKPLVLPPNQKYGFSFVCNNCGSLHVSSGQTYREGENPTTSFSCKDCGQEEEYC